MKSQAPDPLALLHELGARLRKADGLAAARLALVNGIQNLLPCDQSVLWVGKTVPVASSSIDKPDTQAPHVQQLAQLFRDRLANAGETLFLDPADLAGVDLYEGYHGVFVPLGLQQGGILIVRPGGAYTPAQGIILHFALRLGLPEILQRSRSRMRASDTGGRDRATRKWTLGLAVVAAIGGLSTVFEVPHTILVPAEIVSSDIFHVKAPIDGLVDEILVIPGQTVSEAQELIRLEPEQIEAQLQIATAEFERLQVQYEQEAMLSLSSEAARARAADVGGLLREKQEQIVFLRTQLDRHTVRAGQSGVVVMPDVEGLRGRPVATGETLMQIANPDALEVDLWIPLTTALPISPDAPVAVFLATRPLGTYPATVIYTTTQAQMREDGTMGYRARARLSYPATSDLLGQQGVARINLGETTLLMRVIWQPLVWLRQATGI
ncbi:HlyD family efflux transporter periplasmic adaptor subunit [Paradonghicola geojensis]|nr:HlyD family efflux transporter periplasmic adaptor subunit [Marivivens geojensis]